MGTMDYEELIYQRCSDFIKAFDTSAYPDVYVFGLAHDSYWISEPMSPEPFESSPHIFYQDAIYIHFNTLSNWQNSIGEASDEMEAKWNPPFWMLEQSMQIAPCTMKELLLRDEWCAALEVPIRRLDENNRPVYEEAKLTKASVEACGRVIHKLHTNGILTAKFGSSVPILVLHDEGILAAETTLKANPTSQPLNEARDTLVGYHGSWL